MDDAPLILTLQLDCESFAFFDGARRRHFPADRNHIPAHLTLFHHLPGERLQEIEPVLESTAAASTTFRMRVTGLRFLGFGSAYQIDSEDLSGLRSGLASEWRDHLKRQDAQPFRPHITIQNKVDAADAKALYAALFATFEAFDVTATGLLLWRYRGGPWELVREFRFGVSSLS
jgi:2'-5' RNA ligase